MSNNTQSKAYKFISKHNLMTLASLDDTGAPVAAAVYYFIDEDFNLYFLTKEQTQKYKNIQNDGRVAITIYNEEDLTIAQGQGQATIVSDDDEQIELMNKLAKLHSTVDKAWFPPIAKLEAGDYAIIKVHLDSLKLGEFDYNQPGLQDVI